MALKVPIFGTFQNLKFKKIIPNFGAKIQIRRFARFRQNSTFGKKRLLTQCALQRSRAKNWTMLRSKYLAYTREIFFFYPFSRLYSAAFTNQHARKDAFCFCGRNFHFLLRAIFPLLESLGKQGSISFLFYSRVKAKVNSSYKCHKKSVYNLHKCFSYR